MSEPYLPYLRFTDGSSLTLDANGNWGFFDKNGVERVVLLQAALVGLAVPAEVALDSETGLSAARTNAINYTPIASAGLYRLSVVVDVTAWTTPATFTIAVTYKDASGNSRTETLQVVRGSTGAAAAAITAVDRWYAELPLIQIDNSATAITVSTTGTFTGSPVYNLAAVLERLS
jgi:hypothetical protein